MVETRSASRVVNHDSSVMDSKLAARAAMASGGYSDEEDSEPGRSDITSSHVKRATKRRRKSADCPQTPKKPRRRGRLELMPTMNLDVLFHILSFLLPMDLLNLSRTSKDFRNLLLRRSSAAAWKAARLHVDGLPDCPPDITEPQYANLVFYPHCHGCDKVVRSVLWQFRARYCSPCLLTYTVDSFDLQDITRAWTGFYAPSHLPSVYLRERRYNRQLFLRKAFDDLLVEGSKTPQDEMPAVLDKRKKHVQEVKKHAEQCQRWSQSVASSRKHELDNLRRNRKEAVIARITEAGYKAELDYVGIYSFEKQNKALFKAKTLTTQAWDRMRPGLITGLDGIRVRRLNFQFYNPRRAILLSEYEKYIQQPPPPGAAFDVMPHAADIAEFDPFKDLIMSPESTKITASSFHSAFQQLPEFISSWRAKIDREFMDHIYFPENHVNSEKQSGSDLLQLATSVFVVQSGNDHRLFMYPEVLSWPGFFCPPERSIGDNIDVSLPGVSLFRCLPWSASRSFYPTTINLFDGTATVVRALGLDPKIASRQDMNALDARFACGKCSSPGRKVVMKWEMAIVHSYRMHRALHPEDMEWTLIEGDELSNVKNYEHEVKPALGDAILHCALCSHHIGAQYLCLDIWEHLDTIHGIPSDKAEYGTHYIADLNSISVIAIVLENDGKVSKHVDPKVPSYSNGREILQYPSHML